jgi:hypothetical protein
VKHNSCKLTKSWCNHICDKNRNNNPVCIKAPLDTALKREQK